MSIWHAFFFWWSILSVCRRGNRTRRRPRQTRVKEERSFSCWWWWTRYIWITVIWQIQRCGWWGRIPATLLKRRQLFTPHHVGGCLLHLLLNTICFTFIPCPWGCNGASTRWEMRPSTRMTTDHHGWIHRRIGNTVTFIIDVCAAGGAGWSTTASQARHCAGISEACCNSVIEAIVAGAFSTSWTFQPKLAKLEY